jgi:transglycosylase-like protein with SLT domain
MSDLRKLVFALVISLIATPLLASDLAILRNGFSIRHEHREVVGSVTRLYPTSDNTGFVEVPTDQIDHFEKDLTPPMPAAKTQAPPQKLDDVINDISGRHHLDPDLINSVIHAESAFNPHAVSSKGAQGLMQLMPQTASQLGVVNTFEPADNLEGGTRYLRELLERYNFDLVKALAAYNAGPGRVDKYRGLPPYSETHAYVSRIIRDFNRKKLAEQKAAAATAKAKPKPVPKSSQLSAVGSQ